MKKVGIITINDDDNYGNRLQNYAIQKVLKQNNIEAITIKNYPTINTKNKYILRVGKFYIKRFIKKFKKIKITERVKCFNEFNKNIKFANKILNPYSKIAKDYDFFLVGSDQVWNPNLGGLSEVSLLNFAKNEQKVAFSASFGIDKLEDRYQEKTRSELLKFKAISVRENVGKEIIDKLTARKDVEVLVDPTMLLTSNDWDKVSKKPKMLKNKKYILNYFLGELSEKRKCEIDKIAKENDCEVINLLNKDEEFYQTGPSEFLYLEKNAFLVCTDSFHSCVFALLYNKPFVIFKRDGIGANMNSRIETLIKKFNLKNREFKEKITKENLEHDYTEAYKILEKEREKSINFLKEALEL